MDIDVDIDECNMSFKARELARAVEETMNPDVPHDQRLAAYKACEYFKEHSPLCVQSGFFLATCCDESHIVRHFGLQLVEHCVKYRWMQMSQQEKLFIKENVMKLLCSGMEPKLQEHTHVKDALSRVVVEMIKREWPQQWPSLLTELSNASKLGPTQTELVLFVFLRLVEDVALLQTLESNQRRKDIYQALTANMSEIFSFFLQIMEDHINMYQNLLNQEQNLEAELHLRVVQVALQTVTGFVEWVSITHIMAGDGRLLQMLCLLLCKKGFQMAAVECLLQVVNRKGRVEERKPLLILFSKDAMDCIHKAIDDISYALSDASYYLFLKKLAQVLTGMGMQLCTLWSKEDGAIGCPEKFHMYLHTILRFTEHSSLVLVHSINSIWMSFFKHDIISKDPVFLQWIPCWVKNAFPKIHKFAYPTIRNFSDVEEIPQNSHLETVAFNGMDFDSEEEYAAFFHRCRTDLLDTYRQATLVSPLQTFTFVEQRLHSYLSRSKPESPEVHQPTFFEWEALSQVLDSVLSRILLCTERPSVETGLRLLEECLQWEPSDPLLLSTLLSCISALFVFLSMARTDENCAGLLPRVLDKIFSALVFTVPGQTKDSRSRVVKNVRRHAASLMVKISHKYPLLLLPMFDRIYAIVQGLNRDPSQLSKLERVTLQEALLLISNHFCDYERQTRFIEEVIGSGAEQWLAMGPAFKGPCEFMAFVGLDRPPVEPSSDDLNGQNRSHIHFCVNLFMAVVKRCTWPDDPDRAARGGFYVTQTETGNPVIRNPAAPHIIPLLPNLLHLLRVFNALWTPQALFLLSEGYRGAHAMLVVDRTNLLGIGSPAPGDPLLDMLRHRAQTPLDRMQHFLTMVHDSCYHILGNAGIGLRRDFYGLPGLAPSLINSVFSNLDVIPDYRLRPIVRVFLKPFVCCCPPAYYESVLVPVLGHFCPYMFQRLNSKWQYITHLYETGNMEDENTDTQEVLEDMLNRTLTREYLDVLKIAVVGVNSDAGTMAMENMEQDDRSEPPRLNSILQSEVSELGSLILRSEATCQAIALCIFRALSWNDTIASLKATFLAAPLVRLLANDGSLTPPVAAHIMTSVLQGLELHGQHEANNGSLLTLGAQVYEILRPKFPSITEVMMQIPGCTASELQKLDEKIVGSSQKGSKVEKAKKEVFKRITNQLIGRNVGQLFRKETRIADLPRLVLPRRQKQQQLEDQLEPDETLCSLFVPSPLHHTSTNVS